MDYSSIRLTISIDERKGVETWLFTYGPELEQKFGYMTLNFSGLSERCKISVRAMDGSIIDELEIDESKITVQISEFEVLPLADYIEMTSELVGAKPRSAEKNQLEEAFCFEMPNVGRFAKELFGVRN